MKMARSPRKIPEVVVNRVGKIGKLFDLPLPKAFIMQEKFLQGDFRIIKMRQIRKGTRRGKRVYLAEFEL